MILDSLISTDELVNHLNDPDWVVVDCRFDLANPGWGRTEYEREHIPGAVYAHLDDDLSGRRSQTTGRHPLPDPQSFIEMCSRLGITTNSQVVVYDTLGGAYASRLWWLLQDYAHSAAAVLDGGFQKWLVESKPRIGGVEHRPPTNFSGSPGQMPTITTREMESLLNRTDRIVIDARSPERFSGLVELIDPVAGHIPGAINRFHGLNLDKNNTFLSPEKLKEEFTTLLGGTPGEKAIVYCGSGVTSCHHILAMKIAGLPIPHLYAGSWSEWITDPQHPIVKDT